MTPSIKQKQLIEAVVNVFETGVSGGIYNSVSITKDGPNGCRQISYGRSQVTEFGSLRNLIKQYIKSGGAYWKKFDYYIELIGNKSLVDDEDFKRLLKDAAFFDEKMRVTQDVFFDKHYFFPALEWANDQGFTKALSMLVIYDSYIQSGGIRDAIRNKFPERTPVNGGNERVWVTQYVESRRKWLATRKNDLTNKTVYRMDTMMDLIDRDNWDLSQLPIVANGFYVVGLGGS